MTSLYFPHYFLIGLYKQIVYYNAVAKWRRSGTSVQQPMPTTTLKALVLGIITIPVLLLILTMTAKYSVSSVELNPGVLDSQLLGWLIVGMGISVLFIGYFGYKFIIFYMETCCVGRDFKLVAEMV